MATITNKQLINFLVSRYYLQESKSFIQKILNQFPEFKYEGTAYRAIVLGPGEKLSLNKKYFLNASWAKGFDGIMSFLDNCHQELDEVTEVVMVESEIEGLDLSRVISYLQGQGEILDHEILQIKREEEVLSTKFSDLTKLDTNCFYDDKLKALIENISYNLNYLLEKQELSGYQFSLVLRELEDAKFFIESLKLPDNYNIIPTFEYLSNLSDESNQEIKSELIRLNFVK